MSPTYKGLRVCPRNEVLEIKDDDGDTYERIITRVLQRETNRAQLAVCPPPESKRDNFEFHGRWVSENAYLRDCEEQDKSNLYCGTVPRQTRLVNSLPFAHQPFFDMSAIRILGCNDVWDNVDLLVGSSSSNVTLVPD
ncbi:unnamed protein product [Dovyalis caffra]|uniref:Uncharacterized protein n=1 Tax=Dovyalis caffra TaxID=77055 RepID=A0AAV1S5C6_9ROSI|nr:unnamed protein product [Dovyalis caffra]